MAVWNCEVGHGKQNSYLPTTFPARMKSCVFLAVHEHGNLTYPDHLIKYNWSRISPLNSHYFYASMMPSDPNRDMSYHIQHHNKYRSTT